MTEIITKAVVGRTKINNNKIYTLEPSVKPNIILGCWLTNHKKTVELDKDVAIINGSFNVNVWYSCNNGTQTTVFEKKIEYQEKEKIIMGTNIINNDKLDTTISCYKEPSVTDAKIISNDQIRVNISKGIEVEIVGEIKIKINDLEGDD